MRELFPIVCIALCGCAAPLPPVVRESLRCEIPASMLEHCTEPIKIEEGITYAQIIDVVREDRENLRICVQRQESLGEAATVCKAAVDKHNQEVREINARNAAQK